MEKLGYGPNKRLAVTMSTRNTAGYRDPAVIAIDQMKEIYIDGTLEPIETANWFPKVIRKDYTVGANISETAVDDPDRCSTRTTPVVRIATTRGSATRKSTRSSTASRPSSTPRRDSSWCGRSSAGWRGRLAPDHLLYPCRHLLAAAREGSQSSRQQRLQQLALRGRVARPVEGCFARQCYPKRAWRG
jgi:hypothetical protein